MYHIAFMVREERDESRPYGSRPKDEPTTAQGIGAFAYCEIFVQTARLFRVRIFLSQISQAFRALLKTSKQLITNHLRKAGHSLCPKSTPKHRKKPPKSSPFTRSKHNDYDVKAQLWPCKSYALTS